MLTLLRNKRWLVLGVVGLALLLLLYVLPGSAMFGRQPMVALSQVPAKIQAEAMTVLSEAGYTPVAPPVWAGASSNWQVPGSYTLFFAAPSSSGSVDVYAAGVDVSSEGQVTRVQRVSRVTDTPGGEESAPVLATTWLAFATRVAGRYQSITCMPLNDMRQSSLFVFDDPAEHIRLHWYIAEQQEMLAVTVMRPGGESRLSIDPSAQHIEPADGGLRYMAVVRGEQAWLPNLVSRIRELPGVGPEKIAFIENVFFTAQDMVTRLLHGQASQASPQSVTPTPPPIVLVHPSPTELPASTSTPTQTASPTAIPTSLETRVPITSPTASATVAPTRAPSTPTASAVPIRTPVAVPGTPVPGGVSIPEGIVRLGTVRPDPQRPYAEVELIEIDPSLLQIKMVPGTWEPRPTTGLVGSGVIPQQDWPNLVAAFNGGFAAMHGYYGMMAERKVYLPAREGVATIATYDDGSLQMGTWGKDLQQTSDMVSFRQNCAPLIENGIIAAETGKLTLWGLSVSNEVYLYRSGLGIRPDGKLIYAVGKPLSAYTLARALQMAGVQYAMQLDVDEFHVVFITYDVKPGQPPKVEGKKLRNDMHGFDGLFLRPFQLDFFYLVRRPQPLANPVRFEPSGGSDASTPLADEALLQRLPGRLTFASNRDGNWEIYTMPASQPAAIRRLTNHPADDLYPAWSSDGQWLAFASRRDGNAEIYTMNVTDGALRRVTNYPSEEWAPEWSPDGQLLAYQSDRNGQSDIYVSAVDGSNERRLTPYQGNNEAPAWSPDGKLIAFDSDFDVEEAVHASINLYLMNADGSAPRRFIAHAESPAWSPDGKTLAFTSMRAGHWQIFLINRDGTGYRQLTSGRYDARSPAWSPDGNWIAFAGDQEGHWELYVVPVAGGAPARLTSGTASNSYPAWGP